MMAPLPSCKHAKLDLNCPQCRSLQKKWYERLEKEGFQDIEYGRDNPTYTTHIPRPTLQEAEEAQVFFSRVLDIYHLWSVTGRSLRDCRLAELYAEQYEKTGTLRGIAAQLKKEGLRPSSKRMVQFTLNEIKLLIIHLSDDLK